MDVTSFQNTINSIQEKLGKDSSSLILDDIGVLLTDNQNVNNELENKDKEIEKYKKLTETLQNVNANLLKQVPMGEEEYNKPKENNENPKDFDYKSVFDEKRKFQTLILTFNVIFYIIYNN